jgi:hypothetical protein
MNFLITPRGELKLNAAMDTESQAAAGKFVDELKSLGVLLPAQGDSLRTVLFFVWIKCMNREINVALLI